MRTGDTLGAAEPGVTYFGRRGLSGSPAPVSVDGLQDGFDAIVDNSAAAATSTGLPGGVLSKGSGKCYMIQDNTASATAGGAIAQGTTQWFALNLTGGCSRPPAAPDPDTLVHAGPHHRTSTC